MLDWLKKKQVDLVTLPSIKEWDGLEEVKRFVLNGWALGAIHGQAHWQRVERNGIILSLEKKDGALQLRKDVNIKVVRLFAYLHDKCRRSDGADLEHGKRSADMLLTVRDTMLKELTDEEFSLLEQACRLHTIEHKTGIPTVDVCFDADRLDLGRVGIEPLPERMATEQGAFYAKFPQKLMETITFLSSHRNQYETAKNG